jgi:hypothetical protein
MDRAKVNGVELEFGVRGANAPPRGNDTSVGSSRVSVCTFSGWPRVSWAPIDAPVAWHAM